MADQISPVPAERIQAVLAAALTDRGAADGQITLNFIRGVVREAAAAHGGQSHEAAEESVVAFFESAVDAVRAALAVRTRSRELRPSSCLRLRIGVHVGRVLFRGDRPFGETQIIASSLEHLAEPGSVLVSSDVKDAVAPRLAAIFKDSAVGPVTHAGRRFATFTVEADKPSFAPGPQPDAALNETMLRPLPDATSRASSPRAKGESARSAPLPVPASDAALNETNLGSPQDPTWRASSPRPKGESAPPPLPVPPSDAALNETNLGSPQDPTWRASSPRPNGESARSAPLPVPPSDAALNETNLGSPQDPTWRASSPRPKGESARSAPLPVPPSDAALNETNLGSPQDPTWRASSPRPKGESAPSAPLPVPPSDATLNETNLGSPQDPTWRASSPRPKGESAPSAPLPVPPSDATLNETNLGSPQDPTSRASSPRPKGESAPPPLPVPPSDAALNDTILGAPQGATSRPSLPRAAGESRSALLPAAWPETTLNETVLGSPQDPTSRASSPRPKGESARSAPLPVPRSDPTLNETNLGSPQRRRAGEATANVHQDASGAFAKISQALLEVRGAIATEAMPTAAHLAAPGATSAKSPASTPPAVKLNETIPSQKGDAPGPLRAKRVSAAPTLSDWDGPLSRLLATRLGPMAPLIVKRELSAAANLAELIDRLAEQIPSAREQAEFRLQAKRLLTES